MCDKCVFIKTLREAKNNTEVSISKVSVRHYEMVSPIKFVILTFCIKELLGKNMYPISQLKRTYAHALETVML